MHAKQLVTVHA